MRKFERLRHIRYFTNCLQNLPKQYSSTDTNRLSLVHFCVQALDILGCLPDHADCCGRVEEDVYIQRDAIVEWIYGLQTLPTTMCESSSLDEDNDGADESSPDYFVGGGFKGGTYLGPLPIASDGAVEDNDNQQKIEERQHPYDHSHLAMTYVSLCTLLALDDDLSRVHKTAILQTLQSLQKEDGSFMAISSNCTNRTTAPDSTTHESISDKEDDDCDLRFMYIGIVTWYILTDRANHEKNDGNDSHTIINIESATSYILSCIAYDGSLGLTPGREGHGGSTFCGIASLYLMGVLDNVMAREELRGWKEDLIRWCVMRQYSLPKEGEDKAYNGFYYDGETNAAAGMQGRPNKLQDTCYSYWIGGTLNILSQSHLLDGWALREYVLTCQSPYGGFGKVVGVLPDLLHSFYSLAWLALSKEGGCCEEGEANTSDDEQKVDSVGTDERTKVGFGSDITQQVHESISQLSTFDCALGICIKRKRVIQKAAIKDLHEKKGIVLLETDWEGQDLQSGEDDKAGGCISTTR